MIQAQCPTCGGSVLKPDPPPKTQDEKVAFRREWDARYDEWKARQQ